MRAVKFVDRQVVVEDMPSPRGEGVLVNVRACGICGSDTTMLDMGYSIFGIPGHEISGQLEDGTPVAIEPLEPCGFCEYCATGDTQVCMKGKSTIFGVGRDGGMAEQILVPASSLVALPRSLDATTAFLVEPLAVAVHGVRRAAIDGSIRVLVMGAGTIGLCAVAAARAAGAEVDLVGRHPAQLAAARQLGAQVIESADGSGSGGNSSGNSGGNSGGNYDVVLDCAGTESAIEAACNALRPKGQLVLLSSSWDKLILPGLIIGAKELDIRVSAMYGRSGSVRDIDAAAAILGANDAVADALISDRFPLDRAPEAFERSRDRKGGAIKVVLEP